jgi:hypothetical protein
MSPNHRGHFSVFLHVQFRSHLERVKSLLAQLLQFPGDVLDRMFRESPVTSRALTTHVIFVEPD